MKPFYSLSYFLCQSISRVFFRLSVKGRKNIPESAPFLVASNHIAYFDPVIIGSLLKHEMAYAARAELFDQFLIKDVIRKLNAFPVQRGKSDISAMKMCLHILQERKIPLLIFPEGTRIKTGKLGTPQRGIAFIAAQTRVTILPVYIENSNRLGACVLFRKRLRVSIGKPILFSEYQHLFADEKRYFELAQMIMANIQKLKDEIHTSKASQTASLPPP